MSRRILCARVVTSLRVAQAHAERSAGTRRELEAQVAAKVKEIERQKDILEKELKHKNIMFDELKSNMQAELKVRERGKGPPSCALVGRRARAADRLTTARVPARAGSEGARGTFPRVLWAY